MVFADIDSSVRAITATRYPTLLMHPHDRQLFGLHGWTRRARAL